jgi:hypothetical protein
VDIKVSRKERRIMSYGPVDVLLDNVFDVFPVFASDARFDGYDFGGQDRTYLIADVEILNDDRAELLDRAMWAVVKQRGADPVEPDDGIQWAEALLEEVPAPMIVQQVHRAVAREGPGVRVTPSTTKHGSTETLNFIIELTNAV